MYVSVLGMRDTTSEGRASETDKRAEGQRKVNGWLNEPYEGGGLLQKSGGGGMARLIKREVEKGIEEKWKKRERMPSYI